MADPAQTKLPYGPSRGLFSAFWATVIFCCGLLIFIFLQDLFSVDGNVFVNILLTGLVLLLISGGTLLFLAGISSLPRGLRRALLWTGISAIGIPVCTVLHNLVYAFVTYLFGADTWGGGGDEPVFFLLAIIIFPLVFLFSAGYTVVMIVRSVKVIPPP